MLTQERPPYERSSFLGVPRRFSEASGNVRFAVCLFFVRCNRKLGAPDLIRPIRDSPTEMSSPDAHPQATDTVAHSPVDANVTTMPHLIYEPEKNDPIACLTPATAVEASHAIKEDHFQDPRCGSCTNHIIEASNTTSHKHRKAVHRPYPVLSDKTRHDCNRLPRTTLSAIGTDDTHTLNRCKSNDEYSMRKLLNCPNVSANASLSLEQPAEELTS